MNSWCTAEERDESAASVSHFTFRLARLWGVWSVNSAGRPRGRTTSYATKELIVRTVLSLKLLGFTSLRHSGSQVFQQRCVARAV
jgi:hypothetical protein